MCRNLSEGGQRCATHTRPGYQAVMGTGDITRVPVGDLAARVDEGFDAVVDYAATRTGARKVREDRDVLASHFLTVDGASARRVSDQARLLAGLDYAIRKAEARTAANRATRQASAAPSVDPVAISEVPPFATKQGYRAENLVVVDGRKVRVTVYRDFYDAQSTFHAEVWTGEGWQAVTHVAGNDPQGKAMPSSGLAKRAESAEVVGQATQDMSDRLVVEARKVLRNTPTPVAAPAARHEPVVVSEESPRGNRQGYDSQRIVEVDGHKVRTRVHADTFYDFQSSLTAEVWTEDGWKNAAYIHPLAPTAPNLPHAGALNHPLSPTHRHDKQAATAACAAAHDALVAQVRALF